MTATLKELGQPVELFETQGPGDATRLARAAAERGARKIIIAGGDGTINEVVNGIAGRGAGDTTGETATATGSDIELAIIPVGTVNVLAKALAVPTSISDACRLAVRGESIPIDLGLAGDRYFTLMAGVGFDALTIKNLDPVLKRALREAAFPISGIKTLITEDLPLISIRSSDGHETSGYFVIAANSRYYGGRFGPTPLAHMQDGLLDFCVLKEKSITEMLRFWLSAIRKEQLDEPRAEYFRAAGAEITCPTDEEVLVQTDGEIVGKLPVKIGLIPGGLRVYAGVGSR